MKVAYFAGSLVKNLDGVSRVLYKIAEYNKANDFESVFISPDTDERIGERTIALRGVRLPVYKEYKFSTSGISSIEKEMSELHFRPDLIHVHSPCSTGFAGLKLAKRFKIPVVATYHTHFPSYLKYHRAAFLSPLVKRYLRYFYNQCDLVLVPSLHLAEELKQWGIKNIRVLPHGVDYTAFNKESYNAGLREKEGTKKILFFAGRLVWEKNLDLLIKAINTLAEKRNDFILWVAGTGSAEKEMRQQMKRTRFFGFCDTSKLSQLYATSEIFIFPSSTETFGNVTLEAMASANCCIAANAGGSASLIDHGQNGLLFDPDKSEELVKQIEEVMDNQEKRNGLAQRAFQFSKRYRWRAILDVQKEMYIDLVNNRDK